jgi:hypothetical protein
MHVAIFKELYLTTGPDVTSPETHTAPRGIIQTVLELL